MALRRTIWVKYLVFSFAVLFALLRSTQYFHAEPLYAANTSSRQIAKFHSTGQQLIFTRHMEKAVEEKLTAPSLPGVQFNGIIFLLLCFLPCIFYLKADRSPDQFLPYYGARLCARLCVFRL